MTGKRNKVCKITHYDIDGKTFLPPLSYSLSNSKIFSSFIIQTLQKLLKQVLGDFSE